MGCSVDTVMMEISFSTMFFHDHPLEVIFDAVDRTGADTLEFWPETPDWWLDGLPMGRLVQEVSSHPFRVPISVHTPVLDLNPCSINPDVVQVSLDWIEYSVRLAEDLGAGVCTIHPGRRTSKRPPSETDYRRLDHMLDIVERVATSSCVQVAIENMEPQVNALLSSPAEVFRLLDEREWLAFTLDTCHASALGESVLEEFLAGAGERIVNIHLSGAEGRVMHLPVKGNAWADTALRLLCDEGYSGLLTLELNDLALDKPLTCEEKMATLASDIAWIRDRIR